MADTVLVTAFKGNHMYISPSEQGFRMDNFKISEIITTQLTENIHNNSAISYLQNNTYSIRNINSCSNPEIQVFDLLGKTIKCITSYNCDDKSAFIDLSNTQPGMYIINVKQESINYTYKVLSF